jgi:hypothetical protein
MIMTEITANMIEQWKRIFLEYKTKLHANRKSSVQIVEYIKSKYPLTEIIDEKWKQIVIDDVLENEQFREKLPIDKKPTAIVFSVQNKGTGKVLYEKQDEIFKEHDIFIGIELETGHFHIEGSSELWDELFAFRGLDEKDLDNFYLVAEYITCLRKYDVLDGVITGTK